MTLIEKQSDLCVDDRKQQVIPREGQQVSLVSRRLFSPAPVSVSVATLDTNCADVNATVHWTQPSHHHSRSILEKCTFAPRRQNDQLATVELTGFTNCGLAQHIRVRIDADDEAAGLPSAWPEKCTLFLANSMSARPSPSAAFSSKFATASH